MVTIFWLFARIVMLLKIDLSFHFALLVFHYDDHGE